MRSVLRRLLAGELTEEEAITELRRLQLDELGGRAKVELCLLYTSDAADE